MLDKTGRAASFRLAHLPANASFLVVRRFGNTVSALGWDTHALTRFRSSAPFSGVFALLPVLTSKAGSATVPSCGKQHTYLPLALYVSWYNAALFVLLLAVKVRARQTAVAAAFAGV